MCLRTQVMRRVHTRRLKVHINVFPKMFLHVFHTRRSKYRGVLVKCCTEEIFRTHRREHCCQVTSGVFSLKVKVLSSFLLPIVLLFLFYLCTLLLPFSSSLLLLFLLHMPNTIGTARTH